MFDAPNRTLTHLSKAHFAGNSEAIVRHLGQFASASRSGDPAAADVVKLSLEKLALIDPHVAIVAAGDIVKHPEVANDLKETAKLGLYKTILDNDKLDWSVPYQTLFNTFTLSRDPKDWLNHDEPAVRKVGQGLVGMLNENAKDVTPAEFVLRHM